ncbi:MAG: DsrE family protein [Pseudomonadota bacterium]
MSATLTFALMDAPFEASRTATVLRLIDSAIDKGCNINVFAYEGAVYLPFSLQAPHGNAVHGRNVEEEDHPLPREWVAALIQKARRRGLVFDWVNCGLCVDERGAVESIEGVRRGSPADFWTMAASADNTLVVGTN